MKKVRILPFIFLISILLASCTAQNSTKIPDALDKAVSEAILKENTDKYYTAEFETESHTVIGVEENDTSVTVYLTLTYRGYATTENGGYKLCAGGYYPAALTFSKSTASDYQIAEFWSPSRGTEYEKSIQEKFPEELWDEALDKDAFANSQIDECNAKADAYFATHPANEIDAK